MRKEEAAGAAGRELNAQKIHWEKTFAGKSDMFGTEPSYLARKAAALFKKERAARILELGACRRNSHLGFLAAKSGKQKPMSDLFLSQMVIRSPKCKQKWEDAISKRNSPTGS
jgi:hypothetical protein